MSLQDINESLEYLPSEEDREAYASSLKSSSKLQTLLPAGLYKLTADVNNPKPDRRANQNRLNSFRQWVVWPKGLALVCSLDPEFGTIRLYPQGGLITQSLREGEITAELASSMVRVKEKISDYLIRIHRQNYALEIIDILSARLCVSKEEMDEIITGLDQED